MAVKIGSARSSYGNTARGDQHIGLEVSTQDWYLHSAGWRVFRAKEHQKRTLLAAAMKAACANNKIGYSQPDRYALYNQVKTKGFDPAKATEATNCDCSSLVRVCCAYAGIMVGDFITSNEPSVLLKSGAFDELTGEKYNKKSDYLGAGDILVTKTKGHTVIVISNGPKYEGKAVPEPVLALGDRELYNGCEGTDVKELQSYLIQLGYPCGSWGADGDFGDATEVAVKLFQGAAKIEQDGEVGPRTLAALKSALLKIEVERGKVVYITGGNCYVRSGPGTQYSVVGGAVKGDQLDYAGETSPDGWLKVSRNGKTGWVSGKYGRRMDING